jgi:hypothetical protein
VVRQKEAQRKDFPGFGGPGFQPGRNAALQRKNSKLVIPSEARDLLFFANAKKRADPSGEGELDSGLAALC